MLLLALGCGGELDSAGPPSLTLVSPTEGATVCGEPLAIDTELENFTLSTVDPEEAAPEEGHMHLWLNGQEVAQSYEEDFIVTGIVDAEYQLRVDLARADHTTLEPYVGVTVYITVDNTVCQ